MKTDELIRGNMYLYMDDDDQQRKALFERTVSLPNGACGFRFKIESSTCRGVAKNLTKQEVITRIFRASNVPK